MTWVVVIKTGTNLNASLSSIEYDKFGQRTKQPVIKCTDWEQGFKQAVEKGYTHALFVDSGTVFLDWQQWQTLVDSYPHQGLIAHLIWHPAQTLRLDSQCWFMDLSLFDVNDFSVAHVKHFDPIRSEKNLHDDYTPLWVRPGTQTVEYDVDGFGQGLIARQLARGKSIVNWNSAARDLKWFLYDQSTREKVYEKMDNYTSLAENQLWVLNNEPTRITTNASLLTPGAGMIWILNIIQPHVQQLQVVDISRTQIKFCKELWNTWDGTDYGNFVWNFIQCNNLKHYELDQADISTLERLKLKSRTKFIEYVNEKFENELAHHNVANFKNQWAAAHVKHPKFTEGNLVEWVLNNGVEQYESIWCSNILSYKWTLLNSTHDEFDEFEKILKTIACI